MRLTPLAGFGPVMEVALYGGVLPAGVTEGTWTLIRRLQIDCSALSYGHHSNGASLLNHFGTPRSQAID